MKPYQVHLFSDETKNLEFLPSEPIFIHNNKRYLNFANFDCRNLRNNEYLRETAKLNIEVKGLAAGEGCLKILEELKKAMFEFKKLEAILLFPDEFSAFLSLFSIFGPKVTYFIEYETTPSIIAAFKHYHNIEYYSHEDVVQLSKLLSGHSEKVLVIDGLYEWLGNISPAQDLIKIAKENNCSVIANELDSFGLLGRDGRGFVELFNLYEDINIEIGSFDRFLGGFGCYIGAKKYLINKLQENIGDIARALPQFMLAVNLAGLELIKNEEINKKIFQRLWNHSRYFISRLKQLGFKTKSETPIIVVSFNNDEEAGEFAKRLSVEGLIVEKQKERIRLSLSVEHSKADLDFCLDRFENLSKELGLK